MRWYFTVAGSHTHVRVFMNGGKCGDLCFRNEEFSQCQEVLRGLVDFIDETKPKPCPHCGSVTHPPGCCAKDGHGG